MYMVQVYSIFLSSMMQVHDPDEVQQSAKVYTTITNLGPNSLHFQSFIVGAYCDF